jgi:hypothetical protein
MNLLSEDREMRDIEELFAALGRSEFRRRFRLSGKEAEYFKQNGMATILELHGILLQGVWLRRIRQTTASRRR